ncbi:MAG: hypothetical protein IKU44_00115 [Firmicutes bacterium]|nr:hypothetical protein [Bacillota bacterium]
MRKNKNNFILVILVSLFFLSSSLWAVVADTPDYSLSERRVLASLPALDMKDILDGDFAEDFDAYATDRFPARDTWRAIKAYTAKVLLQKDHHGLYTAKGHICKIEYPMKEPMLNRAIAIFDKIHQKYLEDNAVYLAIIPDKNCYLAPESGHLSMDYESFTSYVAEGCDFAQYIEIADLLDASDYYFTDSHWRQEKILDVSDRLKEAMGISTPKSTNSTNYTKKTLESPFYGVYSGQSALNITPDTIHYLTSDVIDAATTKGATAVYDFQKATGKDPYEFFLSGNQSIITIHSPKAQTDKRLILFRDSFGSSLAPLLLDEYSEIVMVDIRYSPVDSLADYVNFNNADVLFLYSTSMLNQATSFKN